MSSVVINGDTSGAITVAVPNVAGTNTVTIAAQTGTLNAAGPAFSVYASGGQTATAGTSVKVQLNTERFDTNNNFDNATNYRFTPTVAGYYQISASITLNNAAALAGLYSIIYKNGAAYAMSSAAANTQTYSAISVNSLIYCNGSTDYIELYVFNSASTNYTTVGNVFGTGDGTYMSGALVRGA